MKHVCIIGCLVILLLTSSCANKGQTGALGGAAAGGLLGQAIGHSTGATLIGVALGGMLGYIVGNEMDKYDRERLTHVYESGNSNRRSSWVNPDTGNRYSVTPQPAYRASGNQVCRRAEIQAVIDGKPQRTSSTACRNSYGEWELQS
ncbi:MAG: RT0821/Lpp0805 family surface protein [Desulfobulbus sp.]|nr:RT0821/Lpp0805 family surface protein [Desulfobulbus sp.]